MKNKNLKWIVMLSGFVIAEVCRGSAGFADAMDPPMSPIDALDESKVGVAARFIPIKAGEFQMGCEWEEAGCESDEVPVHTVELTKDFEMQATAVTQLQYFLVMGRNPSHFRKQEHCDENNFKVYAGLSLCANHPVESIQPNNVEKFIAKLNSLQTDYTYRLPTEAEREYATRAGMPSTFPYSFGFNDTNELEKYGWYVENSAARTHAVALKKPNPHGLYDMHGNVWELVQDIYQGDYYKESPRTDPTGPTPTADSLSYDRERVIRGGSWRSEVFALRSASRAEEDYSDEFRQELGFRLVREKKLTFK